MITCRTVHQGAAPCPRPVSLVNRPPRRWPLRLTSAPSTGQSSGSALTVLHPPFLILKLWLTCPLKHPASLSLTQQPTPTWRPYPIQPRRVLPYWFLVWLLSLLFEEIEYYSNTLYFDDQIQYCLFCQNLWKWNLGSTDFPPTSGQIPATSGKTEWLNGDTHKAYLLPITGQPCLNFSHFKIPIVSDSFHSSSPLPFPFHYTHELLFLALYLNYKFYYLGSS